MWKCPKCGREFKNTDQQHFCGDISSVGEYIAAQDVIFRPVLESVRAVIRKAAPDAIEKISWRMPTFWQKENLIHFAVFKNHLGVYPGDMTDSPFKERLSGYQTSKGTIRFPYDSVDLELIGDIARWRVETVLC